MSPVRGSGPCETPGELAGPAGLAGLAGLARAGVAGRAVLVVDDDPANAKLLDVVLRSAGWDVRVAESAEAALEVLEDFRPRIMMLDLVLPSMSGLVLAERLKTDPRTSAIVLVAMTALRGPGPERLALEVGCAACLESPLDVVALPGLLHAHLESAR